MPDFTYPTNQELRLIAQIKLPNLTQNRPIFDILPVTTSDSSVLMWEQEDDWPGLQQARGLNGKPPRVQHTGGKRFIARPGTYGEHEVIDEEELTNRRPWGEFSGAISVDDLVTRLQDKLLGRRLDRIEYIGWTLLTSGTFSVASPSGAIIHTDQITLTGYNGTDWSDYANAWPLRDFRNVQLLARGKSVTFGASARAYMNRVTANHMLSNQNANDLMGRFRGVQTTANLADANRVLESEDSPGIVVFDGGYTNDSNTFVPFIPDFKVVVVGRRTDGAPIGEYRMTRNAANPNRAPGAYQKVFDKTETEVPPTIEVHDGHNGGPVLMFPSAIVNMDVGP